MGSPARLEDLAALTLPAKDITALATCRPGDCDLKLSTAAMARFRNQVNWSSPNAAQQALDVVRALILELVRAYQANGNDALGQYDDGGDPLPVAEEFRALLASGNLLPVPVPDSWRTRSTTRAIAPPAPRISCRAAALLCRSSREL
jgi:hypothetical protein